MISSYMHGARSILASRISGSIRYLILHVTSKCNATCEMCMMHDRMARLSHHKEMTPEQLRKVAGSLRCLPQLTFSGGEPLLREDLAEISEIFYRNSGTRFFSLPSNALSPDRLEIFLGEFHNRCPKGFLNICLPFHDIPASFDEICGVRGGLDLFRQTCRLIMKHIQSHRNVSCWLNCVVTRRNSSRLKEIIDSMETEGVSFPSGLSYCRGNIRNPQLMNFSPSEYSSGCRYYFQHRNKFSRSNPYSLVLDAIGMQISDWVTDVAGGSVNNLKCRAGTSFLVIYPDGTVSPCEMMDCRDSYFSPGHPPDSNLGELSHYDYNLKELLSSDQSRQLLDWIRTNPCACTWECAIYDRIMHSPVELTKLSLRIIHRLLRS